jgi:hypothetical protein
MMAAPCLSTLTVFPSAAPYRIDQVMAAPQAMALLFAAQGAVAGAMGWAGTTHRSRLWNGLAATLVALVAVFFTLASWGNSDTTKLSHFMAQRPNPIPLEPLWTLITPLVVHLPYRMSLVHGLVAAGYAAAPILLARAWGAAPWGGWWALVITCSPMLRGFLQNAHSRQALAVLLLLPLLLWSARLLSINRRWLGASVLLSALSHNTFAFNLALSLSPWLQRLPELLRACPWRSGSWRWRNQWPLLVVAAGVLVLLLLLTPIALERLISYTQDPYFNRYPLRRIIGRLQGALALGLVLACLQRRLTPLQLLRCPLTQLLLGFGLLYLGIQQSIAQIWLPQITSRLADGVALFLLILYLAWLHRHKAHWCLLPVMYVTFQYWLEGRILASGELGCGSNDEFLCIPDRWPWQVHY